MQTSEYECNGKKCVYKLWLNYYEIGIFNQISNRNVDLGKRPNNIKFQWIQLNLLKSKNNLRGNGSFHLTDFWTMFALDFINRPIVESHPFTENESVKYRLIILDLNGNLTQKNVKEHFNCQYSEFIDFKPFICTSYFAVWHLKHESFIQLASFYIWWFSFCSNQKFPLKYKW